MVPLSVLDARPGADALCVYICLVRHANAAGLCWPSLKRMADQTGLAIGTIRKALRKLQELSLITVRVRKQHGNVRWLEFSITVSRRDTVAVSRDDTDAVSGRDTAPCHAVSTELDVVELDPKNEKRYAPRFAEPKRTPAFKRPSKLDELRRLRAVRA